LSFIACKSFLFKGEESPPPIFEWKGYQITKEDAEVRLIILGPPGSGKGTQADMLSVKYDISHIATGDILRAAIKEGTELGKKAEGYVRSGALVPDEIVIGIIKDRLAGRSLSSHQKGFILDGFPRTIAQAEALDDTLNELKMNLEMVIDLEVPDEEIIKRISGRRLCRRCSASYHLIYSPPEKEGVCDKCGGELYQRDDDKEETIKRRLKVYTAQTEPLIEYYEGRGKLKKVDGKPSIPEVQKAILALLAEN